MLEEELRERGVVFLGIFIDDEEKAWNKIIKDKGIVGYN
jgi:hypothetical protein